ncbi:MAG: hypothetical protein ND895_10975 [Pyrinomonadaceae bacterium]|nr:hypothetical protein [Pyrinomonadaceae bacterium]
MKISPKLSSALKSETAMRAVQVGAAAIAIGLIFWRLQFSTDAICCGDFDGYYHAKWSRLLWEGLRNRTFPPIFTWLPLTTLNPNDYVDHHFLFHIFQIPFTFRDPRLGVKIASTIFASVAILSCYWLLVHHRIRYVMVWLVALLACSAPFLYRLNMAKAPPFAIIYLIAGIYFLFKKKYWLLGPLAFVFTLTYDMFVLLILAVFIWVAVIGWTERRFEWRPIVWVLAGTAAGFIINPYFPKNLHLFYQHVKMKVVLSDFSTKVGGEWDPYSSWEFIGNSLVACVAMLVGYIAFDPADRKRANHPLFFLLFSTALMIMTARWKRIAEYWPPFAVMFSAFALQPWLVGARSALTGLPPDLRDELQPFLDRKEPGPEPIAEDRTELVRIVVAAAIAVLLGVVLAFNLRKTADDIKGSQPHDYYRAGAEWMRAHVSPSEIIFNTEWDDFPRLFYYDTTHKYISGLDPTYLYDRDQALSKLYDRITLGEEEDPGPLIRNRFGARYVFTDNRDNHHEKFYFNATESGWFEIIYEDTECTILHILDKKVESPLELPESGVINDDEAPLPDEEPPRNEQP